jgi:hypothetical protein
MAGPVYPEDEIDRAHEAKRRPDVIPLEPLAHVEHGERREDGERDHLLQDLQLGERDAGAVAEAIGRDLEQVLEERDAPAHERGDVPRARLQVLQVPVPRERHEKVGRGQQASP